MIHATNTVTESVMSEAMRRFRPAVESSNSAMQEIYLRIAKWAKCSARTNVLITGETGVGKEVLAKMLHDLSKRDPEKFVVLNCAAIPETMFERELFGHVKGAFTGATTTEIGLFEQAHGGTIMLDEIGELPLNLQCKLLRVVEERRVRRLGSSVSRPFDVRIIAATNVDLEKAVKENRFREDLYHRLNDVTVHVPPLRERALDIPMLAERLLEEESIALAWPTPIRLAPETVASLSAYSFPGNVRELRKALSRAILESEGEWIFPEHLPERMRVLGQKTRPKMLDARALKQMVEYERIRWALEQTAGNQTRAAQLLAMPLRTFVSRIVRHKINRPKKSAEHARRPAA